MQDYLLKPVRTAAILTNSYVAGTVIGIDELNVGLHNQILLYLVFTKGSLTSLEVKVEFSNDNSTFVQETVESVSGGTATFSLLEHSTTASGNYRLAIPVKDRFIKVSAKGTGTVTGSSLTINAIVGVV